MEETALEDEVETVVVVVAIEMEDVTITKNLEEEEVCKKKPLKN